MSGPLNVSDIAAPHTLSDSVPEACMKAALPHRDPIGGGQKSVSYFQLTVRNGLRCSAASAYLPPVGRRPGKPPT